MEYCSRPAALRATELESSTREQRGSPHDGGSGSAAVAMSTMADGQSPRAAAAAFTPELSALIDDTVYGRVWADERLSARDRSIATVAVLTALYRPDELRAHLQRAVANGVTQTELSALITHVACYAGVPGAVSASAIAAEIFGVDEGPVR